ncbi:MAG TPA: type I polyketide synthase, partial [Candidatus Binataceae bacterium]|nr:type I polyketide synthase [Candidatus Binataceae bacterium]
MQDSPSLDQNSVAIIGMAGRFPGAKDIDEFWRNLTIGAESIVRLTDAQLLAAGAEPAELRDPAYIKAAAVLDDIDLFDAAFFGLSAKDAAIMDPQHRFFLECAWHAFEHAGWAVEQFDGKIGVYAGSGMNTYLIHNLLANRKLIREAGLFALKQTGNDKDVLATRVSYQLNLTGPSLAVQTACSTSLVAVHLACQALLNRECDMALAGGVTIEIPHGRGYHYREGEILSRDGHCRPFDADSSGTIFGSGAATVVLRRLEDALRDGDAIHAVIRGSAINNDGSRKVGFLAPSVTGQAEVIGEAMAAAGVEADSISYIEAHGTGTKVGDPIEIEALIQAFRGGTSRRGFCAVGSLKANIGHLDAAAGVTGLIKTALALKHRQLPPTINFRQPNPLIDFANSPFFVASALNEWQAETGVRWAGVTSLGIGGTNAHVILEEAPPAEAASPARKHELLTLSAKTPMALDAMARNLADYLERAEATLDDVAFTCHLGRAALPYRRAIVCSNGSEAAALMRRGDESKVITRTSEEREPAVAFLFSGQGAQYPGMARALYETNAEFKSIVDYCCDFLEPLLGLDLRSVIFPEAANAASAATTLAQTRLTQPALFVIEYALAQLWIGLGIKPAAMLGHSIGEFTAACAAGVFSLDDSLRIVAERGRLMQSLPGGVMIAVAAAESDVAKMIDSRCAIASVNAPDQCVVAGPADAIGTIEAELGRRKLHSQRLSVSHAFHSPMMDAIVKPFAAFVGRFQAKRPAMRWVSSATGTWIGEEAARPEYWARQLRGTVRFHDGITTLMKAGATIFLEAGPGHTLASLAAHHPEQPAGVQTISTLAGAREEVPADASFLRALGILWASGARIDWRRYHRGERRYRVALPGYPFERRRFWIDPDPPIAAAVTSNTVKAEGQAAEAKGLYQPVWKEAMLPASPNHADSPSGPWLIFADAQGLAGRAAAILRERGEKVAVVRPGEAFVRRSNEEIEIVPAKRADYDALAAALRADGLIPRRILHLWSVLETIPADGELDELDDTIAASFWSLLFFTQAFGADIGNGGRLAIGSNQLMAPEGERSSRPERALLAGPCGVIPKELPELQCVHADFVMPSGVTASNGNRGHALGDIALQLIAELDSGIGDSPVAYRRGRRFVRTHQPLARQQEPIKLRDGAVNLITGGLGGIGLALAEAIAQASKACIVLLGRSGLPPRDEWPRLIESGGKQAAILRKIEAIEHAGAQVMTVAADVTDEAAMRAALAAIHQRFGAVTGVIHAAGTIADAPALSKSPAAAAAVLAPKVRGTLVLERVLAGEPLGYMILCSSVSSIVAPAGQVDYAAANAFLDAFAQARSESMPYPVIALQFPRWSDVGMAADSEKAAEAAPEIGNHANNGAARSEIIAETTLSLASDWIVREHRTLDGTGIFPGTGYVEMILKAAQELMPGERITIQDLQFKRPLEAAPGATRRVRTRLKPNGTDYQFAASAQTQAGWEETASARVLLEREHGNSIYDLSALRRRCANREMIFSHRQNRVQESFFDFGPRWKVLDRISFGNGEALARVELAAEFLGDLGSYRVHPALLDMATGAALFLIPDYEILRSAYVPMNYGHIRVQRALPASFYSYLRMRGGSSADNPIVTFDADIIDEEGNSLIEIREFMMRRIQDGLKLAAQPGPIEAAP